MWIDSKRGCCTEPNNQFTKLSFLLFILSSLFPVLDAPRTITNVYWTRSAKWLHFCSWRKGMEQKKIAKWIKKFASEKKNMATSFTGYRKRRMMMIGYHWKSLSLTLNAFAHPTYGSNTKRPIETFHFKSLSVSGLKWTDREVESS